MMNKNIYVQWCYIPWDGHNEAQSVVNIVMLLFKISHNVKRENVRVDCCPVWAYCTQIMPTTQWKQKGLFS
jgi:hypothetical protein